MASKSVNVKTPVYPMDERVCVTFLKTEIIVPIQGLMISHVSSTTAPPRSSKSKKAATAASMTATVICGAFLFNQLSRVCGALNSHRLNLNAKHEVYSLF